jgi:hypothetical protein
VDARGCHRLVRWTFSAVTRESFHWEGHVLEDGDEWRLAEDFRARRIAR